MTEVSIIGVDLAKNVFQLYGACFDGSVAFRKKSEPSATSQVSRPTPSMCGCDGGFGWGRQIAEMGHEVKLIAPI